MRTGRKNTAVLACAVALGLALLWPCARQVSADSGATRPAGRSAVHAAAQPAVDTAQDAAEAEAKAAEVAKTARDAEAATLVERRCTRCHGPKRICQALGVKGKGAWDMTVSLMMLHGAAVNVGQKELIVDWLWELPAGSSPPCP